MSCWRCCSTALAERARTLSRGIRVERSRANCTPSQRLFSTPVINRSTCLDFARLGIQPQLGEQLLLFGEIRRLGDQQLGEKFGTLPVGGTGMDPIVLDSGQQAGNVGQIGRHRILRPVERRGQPARDDPCRNGAG